MSTTLTKKAKKALPVLVLCPYCGEPAVLVDSAELYHGRSYGPAYLCRPCYAWVGCHPGTIKPLGRLANAELRKAKIAAHDAFDPLWIDGVPKGPARRKAYQWLSEQLHIDVHKCHIGMFDVELCERTVVVCRDRNMPSNTKPSEEMTKA